MTYRRVDDDGDMMPSHNSSEMLRDVEAVMAAVNSRLRLLSGEWWENPELGFRVPAFLWQGVRAATGAQLLSSYITAYIAETPGVRAVADVDGVVDGRVFKYKCTVVTDFGNTAEEVSQDVLLRAVS